MTPPNFELGGVYDFSGVFTCEETNLIPYVCKQCPFQTDVLISLWAHVKLHLETPTIVLPSPINSLRKSICKGCSFGSYSILQWLKHKNKCPNIKKPVYVKEYGCILCIYTARNLASLKTHYLLKHRNFIQEKDINYFHCDKCTFKTTYERGLKKHTASMHDLTKRSLKCDFCDYKTHHVTNMKYHITTIHPNEIDSEWLQCGQCEYQTKSNSALKKHNKNQHVKEFLQCEQCPYKTNRKHGLKYHYFAKHNVFECEQENKEWVYCDKCTFKTKYVGNLSRHNVQKHRNACVIRCDLCDFVTKSHVSLSKHKRRHLTKTEWFQCDKCSYRTKYRKKLEKHGCGDNISLTNVATAPPT